MSQAIADRSPLKSLIRVTSLSVPDELDSPEALELAALQLPGMREAVQIKADEMQARLAERFNAGKLSSAEFVKRSEQIPNTARRLCCRQAIRSGRVPHVKVLQHDGGHNLILRNFYEDLFARFSNGNSAGVNQTLQIKYLALGLSYAPTTFTQADLTSEFFRKVVDPSDTYDDGLSTFYASLYLKKTDANPTGVTTVASATSTQITATSATGFVTNGRYQLETANATYVFTATLSGSVLTCSEITGGSLINASAFDPADLPQAGNTLVILISEGGCIIGNDATATLNSGKPLNRKRLSTLKNASISLSFDYILTATSIDT